MMDSETPPQASPPLRVDNFKVSSCRISPDHPAARGTEETAPEGDISTVKGQGEAAPAGTNNTGPELSSLDPETIAEEHRTLMGIVVERILSARRGLNEAFTSLLRGFEVCNVITTLFTQKCTCV